MADWTDMVTALATSVGVLVVLVGGFVAWLQLKGLKQQTGLSALAEIYETFRSDSHREDRRLVYQKMPKDLDLSNLDENLYRSAQGVLVSLNGIGFLVHKGLVPMDQALAELIGPPTIRMWDKLKEFVQLERERRNEKTYMRFVEELAHKCQRKLPYFKPAYF